MHKKFWFIFTIHWNYSIKRNGVLIFNNKDESLIIMSKNSQTNGAHAIGTY